MTRKRSARELLVAAKLRGTQVRVISPNVELQRKHKNMREKFADAKVWWRLVETRVKRPEWFVKIPEGQGEIDWYWVYADRKVYCVHEPYDG